MTRLHRSLSVVVGIVVSLALCNHSFAQPANDSYDDPMPLSIGLTPFTTIGATLDGPAACASLSADVWALYIAGASDFVTISCCSNANFNTVFVLYDGATGIGTLIACNDDFCGLQSQITFAAMIGHSYKLRVGGFGGAMGMGALTVSESPTGVPDQALSLPPRVLALRNPSGIPVNFEASSPRELEGANLVIYDIRGGVMARLPFGGLVSAAERMTWNGRNQRREPVPSGIYFYRLEYAGGQTDAFKLVVLR